MARRIECPKCGAMNAAGEVCRHCPPAPSGSLFLRGWVVRHLKTGGEYVIVSDARDKLRIEATDEPAYAYTSTDPGEHPTWVRSASEMEDGRFVQVSPQRQGGAGVGAQSCSLPLLHDPILAIDTSDPEVLDILSMLSYTTGPYAGHLRKCGYEIKRKIEVEQAGVMLWWLSLYQRHGKDWREKGAAELRAMTEAAKVRAAANAAGAADE